MAERGLNVLDKRLVNLMQKRATAVLKHWRERGVIKSKPGKEQFLLWDISSR